MAVKYTEEQEKLLYNDYSQAKTPEERDAIIENYIVEFGKPKRSIIAKLSRMGIYISKAKISKVTGTKPETKEQLVAKIESRFGVGDGDFIGLEKAPKLVLTALLNRKVLN
jgi:hypothetical protein